MKHITALSLVFSLFITLLCVSPSSSLAESMNGSQYQLDFTPDAHTAPENNSIETIQKDIETNKTISGNNYLITYSYDKTLKDIPFILSLGSKILNFGEIKPGEPLIRSHTIKVLPGTAQGYQVVAYQDHNLKSTNAEIPSTSCDSGSCTQILADIWSSPLTYGFGYRCDNTQGTLCTEGFNKDYYKRFSNQSLNEEPSRIINSLSSEPAESVLSYKINIPGNQEQKGYQNTIYYIAVPNF